MKRFVLTSLVLSMAMALVTACNVSIDSDSQRSVRPESGTYSLSVAIDPSAGGHIRHSAGGGEGEFRFESGEVVEFMAVATEGYQFNYWSGDLAGDNDTVRLVMDSDKTVTAHFSSTELYILTVAAEPSAGGHIRHSAGGGEGEFRFEGDEVVEFMAVATEGYQFDYWGGDLSGDNDTVRLVMDSDKTVTAHFSSTELYILTVAAEPSAGGHIRHSAGGGEGEFRFTSGEVVEFMAVVTEGYQFDYWSGDLSGDNDTVRLVMDSDKTVTAHFSSAETVAGIYALRVEADPLEGGYVRPGSGVYDSDEVLTITAVAAEGYQFDYWSGDLSDRDDTVRLVMDDNKWVVAHFSPVEMITGTYALRVEADPPEAGYVRPGSGVYDNGEALTMMAVAADGYQFDYWSGDLSGREDTSRLVMDDNKWVVAHFKRR